MGVATEKKRKVSFNAEGEDDITEAPAPGKEKEDEKRVAMPSLPLPLTLPEKKFLLAVERADLNSVKKMLQKAARHPKYMNKNCVDPMGRGALLMAIDNENLEMLELLVVMGVETRDSLLHAISVEFVEAVEVLLEHEELVHKDGDPYSWEVMDRQTASFTPEITPLTLAAHRNNYEILKILIDRGAALPMPHDIRCGCEPCLKSTAEDSLGHSMSRINAYRALASPSLIALSSTDPIITAFELSEELKRLSYEENEFSQEYKDLRQQCRSFAEELLSHSRCSTELAVILNYDPEAAPYEDGDAMKLHRLEQAIDFKQKSFVSHPNVQQLMGALWYAGLPGFKRMPTLGKLFILSKICFGFPYYCFQYMLFPTSTTSKQIKTPFMKFLLHSAAYLFFLILLILISVRFEEKFILYIGTASMRAQVEESMKRPRGQGPTPIEILILLYVFGFIWEEVQDMIRDGIEKYSRDMWNVLDILRDGLYIFTMVLRIVAFIQQSIEISENPQSAYVPREDWEDTDPQLISEGLFAAANVLSALKLIHIFSINPYLGPLQISLGRMVVDIVKFFFIYVLVLFAFACGLTQLLWYFNELERQKCYSLPGGLPDWLKHSDSCMKWRRFHNLFESSQSLFWAGFGMVGLDDFELTGSGAYTRFWAMLLFGAYSIINIIVLLNLLIAMMSSSYAFIVDHADTEWKFARTKLWMSFFDERSTLPPPFNILPNAKRLGKLFSFSSKEGNKLTKKWSSRAIRRARKACDYRYLSVMRALIWRYVCAMQQKSIEREVTEDDINEVKGDISSLRFELIDLFATNGLDVSKCEKKTKAGLGRKMRMWERRLMRDFHVAPAMGNTEAGENDRGDVPETATEQFRRLAKMALAATMTNTDVAHSGPMTGGNQIGFRKKHKDDAYSKLRYAMEMARRKMAQSTPENSPGSSRGVSPIPEVYNGPNLMNTLKGLDLSPLASTNQSPSHAIVSSGAKPNWKKLQDGKATDLSKLTIPGRRAETTLKGADEPPAVEPDLYQDNRPKKVNKMSGSLDSVSTLPNKSPSPELRKSETPGSGSLDLENQPDIVIKPASPVSRTTSPNFNPQIVVRSSTPLPSKPLGKRSAPVAPETAPDPIVMISALSNYQLPGDINTGNSVGSLKNIFESKNMDVNNGTKFYAPNKSNISPPRGDKNSNKDNLEQIIVPSPAQYTIDQPKSPECNSLILDPERLILTPSPAASPQPPSTRAPSHVSVTIDHEERRAGHTAEVDSYLGFPGSQRDSPMPIFRPRPGSLDSESFDDDLYL